MELSKTSYQEINKLFSKLGLKLTMQRYAILEYLMNTKEHPSAEMIYNALKEKYPTITLSTVYNTLEIFEEKGLIKRVPTFTGTARYDATISPHLHIIMNQDGKIIDLHDQQIIDIIHKHLKEKHNIDIEPENIYLLISQQAKA